VAALNGVRPPVGQLIRKVVIVHATGCTATPSSSSPTAAPLPSFSSRIPIKRSLLPPPQRPRSPASLSTATCRTSRKSTSGCGPLDIPSEDVVIKDHGYCTSLYVYDPNGVRLEFTAECDEMPEILVRQKATAQRDPTTNACAASSTGQTLPDAALATTSYAANLVRTSRPRPRVDRPAAILMAVCGRTGAVEDLFKGLRGTCVAFIEGRGIPGRDFETAVFCALADLRRHHRDHEGNHRPAL
jgi:hypothetical protein